MWEAKVVGVADAADAVDKAETNWNDKVTRDLSDLITSIIKCEMKLLIHSQTQRVQPYFNEHMTTYPSWD